MKDILQFFYENGQIMKDNIYLFASWTILCVSSTSAVMARRNDRKNREIQEENQRLREMYDVLYKQYGDMDETSRVLMGKGTTSAVTAEVISKKFRYSGKKQKKNKSKH